MFDIIRCEAEPSSFGFEKFYSHNDVSINRVKDLKEATNYKNKKTLILVDDYNFDEGSVKLIAEKKKACFLINLHDLKKCKGTSRAILISKLRTFLKLCVKYGALYTFATFAENKIQIRKPSEIMHIAMILGVNEGQSKFALKMLQHYV
ncbi:hypothetical protein KKB44_01525 [Candidatus Micrarchaeota archaeon]|nr:hypothetical protein [Candidatus Micrarchaeota archaeon]